MEFKHKPVLLEEVIEGLNIISNGTYLDCTMGGGGHSLEILKRLSPIGHLYGFDRDLDAVNTCIKKFEKENGPIFEKHNSYSANP